MRTLLLAAVAVAALGGCAGAPTDTAALAPPTGSQPSEQDRAWMRAIHEGNLAEMQAGQLAQGKGGTAQIRAVGKMLVVDHTELDTKVTRTATKLGIQLPGSPNAEQRAQVLRLQDATGMDFDQEFLGSMTTSHKRAVAATKAELANGSSPQVLALAKAALPALERHLSALEEASAAGSSPGGSPAPHTPASPAPRTPVPPTSPMSPMTPTGHE